MDRILFMAPSDEIAKVAEKVTGEMKLEIPIKVGINQQAVDIVLSYPDIGIVISRGGTAEEIRQKTDKAVVEISVATTDFLNSVSKIAQNGVTRIGVVGRKNMIDDVVQDISLSSIELLMRPCQDDNEAKKIVEQFAKSGVGGIVGDAAGTRLAKEYGIVFEPLNSGYASIKRAINEAFKIAEAQQQERTREEEREKQIQQNVAEIYTAIEQAAAATEELTASAQELAATTRETANLAQKSAQNVDNTTKILDIIRRVAQQTNLLGINAAIEAARAGENGRGFSIVANEVRKLADESSQSIGNINDMLSQFRNSSSQVVHYVEQSNGITQDQAKATQEIAQKLEGLRSVGQKLLDMAERKA